MKNLQQIYKRALWSCIILFLIKPAPVYTASAYRESASTSQELVKKMLERQQLTPLEVDKRALLKEKILGHIGNHDADFSPSSQSVAQILSRMSLEAAFESIKAKGAITPAITEYLRAYSSVIHRSEKFDRQEFRGLDDYDFIEKKYAARPQRAKNSSNPKYNHKTGRILTFHGQEDTLSLFFEAQLLKESALLHRLAEDTEAQILSVHKDQTHMPLKELYSALEASAHNTIRAYLESKNESELIKIANTAHYLDIQKLYEAVTNHLAHILLNDNAPATTFTQMFFDRETSLTGFIKEETKQQLQTILPKNIIEDITRKIGFKFTEKYTILYGLEGSIAWSPDNSRLASVTSSGIVRIWDIPTAKEIHNLGMGHDSSPHNRPTIAWSSDGSEVSSTSKDGVITSWDSNTGKQTALSIPLKDIQSQSRFNKIWSPNKKYIAMPSEKKVALQLQHFDTLKGLHLITEMRPGVEVDIVDAATGNLVHTLATIPFGEPSFIKKIVWAHDNSKIIIARSNIIEIWDITRGKLIRTLRLPRVGIPEIKSVACSFDGKEIVSVSSNGAICIWNVDVSEEKLTHTKCIDDYYKADIAFSPDGSKLALSSQIDHGNCCIWESETFEQKQERVYRLIQRAALADAQQEKRKSSCVIN